MMSQEEDPVRQIRKYLASYFSKDVRFKSIDKHFDALQSIYLVYEKGFTIEKLDGVIEELTHAIKESDEQKGEKALNAIQKDLQKLQQQLKRNEHCKLMQSTDIDWLKNLKRELLSTGVKLEVPGESSSVSVLKKDIDAIVREMKKENAKEADWNTRQGKLFSVSQSTESGQTEGISQKEKQVMDNWKEEKIGFQDKIQAMEIQIKELKRENEQLLSKINEKEVRVYREKTEIDDIKGRNPTHHSDTKEECERLKKEVEDLRHLNTKLVGEKNYWLTRLSEIAGSKMTEGNPSITDLSDPNRPIKLAERFGELYDGPWTDVLEEFTKDAKNSQHQLKQEIDAINEMQIFLKDISSVCTEMAENIIKDLTRSLRLKEENVSYELRQAMASLRKLASQTSIGTVKQECIGITRKKRKLKLYDLKASKVFVDTCTDICWFMTIQQPAMMFYFGENKKNGPFEKDFFQFYTKSGSFLDFTVWPALKLHKKGPLLRKGVDEPVADSK